MKPFFSIIIPTYNRAQMIGSAIESMLQQTYLSWELVIVDDGSSDNTAEVVAGYADGRVKYFYQKNAERCAARNNGIANSNGGYICFLDSDDKLDKDYLRGLHEFLSANSYPVAMCISDMVLLDGDKASVIKTPAITGNIYDWLFTNPVVPGRVCLHQSIIKNTALQFDIDIPIGEDVILWLRIADKYPLLITGVQSVIYYLHEGNSVNKNNPSAIKMREGIYLAKNRYEDVYAKITPAVFNAWLSRVNTNIALYYLRRRERIKSLYWTLKALALAPVHEHTKYRVNILLQALGVRRVIE